MITYITVVTNNVQSTGLTGATVSISLPPAALTSSYDLQVGQRLGRGCKRWFTAAGFSVGSAVQRC